MPTVFLLCGLPTSGKTTLARQLEANGAARFTLDERMLAKYDLTIFDKDYGPRSMEEKERIWREALELLRRGMDVVLDWSLWSRGLRSEWCGRVRAAGFQYKL